jgi:hypothetical protein
MKRVNWFRVKAIAVLAATLIFAPIIVQAAAPAFPALGSSINAYSFHISGAQTATVASVVQFNAPFDMRLLYATASVSAKSGSFINAHGASNVTVRNNGLAALTMDLVQPAAGGVQEATPTTANLTVAKNMPITADLTLWGTSPSVTNVTLVIWAQRNQ